MKKSLLTPAFAIAALLHLGALGASQVAAQSEITPPEIVAKGDPVFPRDLMTQGVPTGEVVIALRVDELGGLEDYLIVGYTLPQFAESVERAMKRWSFKPAMRDGEPITSSFKVRVVFEAQGAVVTQTVMDAASFLWLRFEYRNMSYRVHQLSELDAIPEPLHVVAPSFPEGLVPPGVRKAVKVEFFIDEQGHVRLPAVEPGVDLELGFRALEAVGEWKFAPPMSKGRPVLVRAVQEFVFEQPVAKAPPKKS